MNDTGLNKCYQLNKDIDNYSITMKDFTTMDVAFRKMLKENPDKNFLQLSITAGHGMCKDRGQWILLNEFSSKDGFYKMVCVEETIRTWSKNNLNCYFIALFAGCREIHRPFFHCNCIASNS